MTTIKDITTFLAFLVWVAVSLPFHWAARKWRRRKVRQAARARLEEATELAVVAVKTMTDAEFDSALGKFGQVRREALENCHCGKCAFDEMAGEEFEYER